MDPLGPLLVDYCTAPFDYGIPIGLAPLLRTFLKSNLKAFFENRVVRLAQKTSSGFIGTRGPADLLAGHGGSAKFPTNSAYGVPRKITLLTQCVPYHQGDGLSALGKIGTAPPYLF